MSDREQRKRARRQGRVGRRQQRFEARRAELERAERAERAACERTRARALVEAILEKGHTNTDFEPFVVDWQDGNLDVHSPEPQRADTVLPTEDALAALPRTSSGEPARVLTIGELYDLGPEAPLPCGCCRVADCYPALGRPPITFE